MSKQNFVLLLISIILLRKSSFATSNSVPTNAQKNSDGTINQSISSIHNNATKLTCKKNEVISECIEGDCQAQTCSDLNRSIPCKRIDPKYCTKGCLCKDGYLRANNGSCVPISKCTFNCTGINEEFASCPQTCPPQTCDSIDHVYNCPLIPVPTNTSNCRPACRCKTGYYRNYLNECISEANCQRSSATTSMTPIPSTTITPTTSEPQNNSETAQAAFRKANLAFAGELLYQSVQNKPGVSFVASALSALIPFTELALFAYGETLQQLLTLLYFTDKNQIRNAFPALLQSFQGQQSVNFVIANKLYANENYPLTNTFEQDAQTIFNSAAQNIDFTNAVTAADIINEWIAEVTNHLIQNIISSGMLNAGTRVVLVNAIYFLGSWSSQFNPANTENRDFYTTPNETKSLPTMYQQGTFNYAEDSNLDAQLLELYYTGNNFSFVIWLPKTPDGLSSMVKKLRDPDTISNSLNLLRSETVQMYIPRMNITTNTDLIKSLQQDNVTDAFNPRTAQFRGIVTTNETIYISNAMQTAYMKVNETGTEAAVVTVVTGVRTAAIAVPQTVYTFDANRPFVFCIKKQQDPVFIGIFTGQ